MATTCVVCGEKVDWNSVIDEFQDIFERADTFGVEALTEQEQVVYEGCCCSEQCFCKLN